MMKWIALILIVLNSCKTQNFHKLQESSVQKQVREPAQEPLKNYTFVQSPSCLTLEKKILKFDFSQLSPITGFVVGPKAQKDFSKTVLKPFLSDGCSTAADGLSYDKNKKYVWIDCCIEHDVAYWLGGDKSEKINADTQFESCVKNKGYPIIAKTYRKVIESFAKAESNYHYRWGYGWNYHRPYQKLSTQEMEQVYQLYPEYQNHWKKELLENTSELQQICFDFDPVFNRMKKIDQWTYNQLNHSLKSSTQIEWAIRIKNANNRLEIKLKSCQKSFRVELYKTDFEFSLLKCNN